MGQIDFYYMAESPPCRTVEMVANMAGVKLNKHSVNLFTGEHREEAFVKLNPLHRVPVIVDGDLNLTESRAIATYLVDRYMSQDNTLYPKDVVKRAKVDELIQQDMGVLFQSASKLLRPMLFQKVEELDEASEEAFREVLSYFNNRLSKNKGSKFMLGDDLTIGDVALAASFSFIEACQYDISEFKELTAYLARLKTSIPNYAEINDGPVENMKKFIKSKQEA